MSTIHDTMNAKSPRFEDVYPRAPFSELIRLVLTAMDALVGQVGRPAARGPVERARR